MGFCENKKCPHYQSTGKHAEYREGMDNCPECGGPLSEIDSYDDRVKSKGLGETLKKIAVTLGLICVVDFLSHIPLPVYQYLKDNALYNRDIPFTMSQSLLATGISPIITGFVMVAILSLILPPFKKWWREGPQGFRKLRLAGLVGTFIFSAGQSYGIIYYWKQMSLKMPLDLMLSSWILMCGAVFFVLFLAEMISRYGVGHGLSLVMLWSLIMDISGEYILFYQELAFGHKYPILVETVIIIGFIAVFVLVLRSFGQLKLKNHDRTDRTIPVNVLNAGLVPVYSIQQFWWIFTLPAMVLSADAQHLIYGKIAPGGTGYTVVVTVLLFVFSFVFSRLFYNGVYMRGDFWGSEKVKLKARGIWKLSVISALVLSFVSFFPTNSLAYMSMISNLGLLALIITVAIILDIKDEISFRVRFGAFEYIECYQDVAEAGLARECLVGHGVNCYVRGYYHRSLYYLFGPFIEMSLAVPVGESEKAKKILGEIYLVPENREEVTL